MGKQVGGGGGGIVMGCEGRVVEDGCFEGVKEVRREKGSAVKERIEIGEKREGEGRDTEMRKEGE